MAGSGNDIITYTGDLQEVNLTYTNPYTGETVTVDGMKRVNNQAYDGQEGTDALFMSSDGDLLVIVDENGEVMIQNIETIIGGDGGDFISLAHSTVTYSDVTISGLNDDDVIWSNSGSDHIYGAGGDDIINGGPGDDFLYGNDDNDEIRGADGNDFISGGGGNDLLYGAGGWGVVELDKSFDDDVVFPDLQEGVDVRDYGADVSFGINNNNLTVDYAAQATLTFRDGYAGYNNTLGVYQVTEEGTIKDVQFLFLNANDVSLNTAQLIDLPVDGDGGEYGFFIVADGYDVNHSYNGLENILDEGVLRFVYDYGGANERDAQVTDNGDDLTLVYDDGTHVDVIDGYDYHTTERDGGTNLNWDGYTHALSGLVDADNADLLRIGFEDLPNLGDADFEDVLFDLNIVEVYADLSENGHDTIIGDEGTDVIYGEGGNDTLMGGADDDVLFGGSGADIFLFQSVDGSVDTIKDFDTSEGDVINITDLLEGYDPVSDAIADFVQLTTDSNGNTEVAVDADGGGDNFVAIAMVEGGVGDTLAHLVDAGHIVADQSVSI